MIETVREIYSHRELLYMLTWREIKVKYKQSIMGFLWAILNPMLVISAGIIVRLGIAHFSGKALVLSEVWSVSVKALPWSFFVASIRSGTNSLVTSSSLITKIYFPRAILPISATMSHGVDFMVAASLLTITLIVAQIGISGYLIWVPILIILLVILIISFTLFLSAANLYFRDVKYIVDAVLTFAIFFTPVFYEAKVAGKWGGILLLNPVAPILEGFNNVIILHKSPNIYWMLYCICITICIFFLALWVFRGLEPKFAERI